MYSVDELSVNEPTAMQAIGELQARLLRLVDWASPSGYG
jgi:hypothetical protein